MRKPVGQRTKGRSIPTKAAESRALAHLVRVSQATPGYGKEGRKERMKEGRKEEDRKKRKVGKSKGESREEGRKEREEIKRKKD